MLQIGWEEEFQDGIHSDFGADVLEFRRSLRDGKQENVTLLVGRLGIVRTMKCVLDDVNSI
jgi:hypothetical protein